MSEAGRRASQAERRNGERVASRRDGNNEDTIDEWGHGARVQMSLLTLFHLHSIPTPPW